MIVTAWTNGRSGYGLKVLPDDRDRYFNRTWTHVFLHLGDVPDGIKININKSSFWDGNCRELISKEIGKWLVANGYSPWPKWSAPKFVMEPVSDNHFRILAK